MLVSIAALMLMVAPAPDDMPTGDEYARCAFIAYAHSETDKDEKAQAAWLAQASDYLEKANAALFPGREPTDAESEALTTKARESINAEIQGMGEVQAAMALDLMLGMCGG